MPLSSRTREARQEARTRPTSGTSTVRRRFDSGTVRALISCPTAARSCPSCTDRRRGRISCRSAPGSRSSCPTPAGSRSRMRPRSLTAAASSLRPGKAPHRCAATFRISRRGRSGRSRPTVSWCLDSHGSCRRTARRCHSSTRRETGTCSRSTAARLSRCRGSNRAST